MKNTTEKILTILLLITLSCKTTELIFPLDSRQIVKEYTENKRKADRKYKNKTLIIEGRVSQVYKNSANQNIIILANVKDKQAIACYLKSEQEINEPLKQYQQIEIKGFCTGLKNNVIIENCSILHK